jgi:hypothetical protein
MQSAKFQFGPAYRANEFDHLRVIVLFDSGAIHPGIDVQKNSDWATHPLANLLLGFYQHRNANLTKAIGDLTHALGICPHDGICQQNVTRSVFACGQQLESGGAFEIENAAVEQRAQGVSELGRLDVGAPAVCIPIQQVQCAANIRGNDLGIEHEGRSYHVI